MSVETTVRKQSFTLNGTTSTFDFTFRALPSNPTDIKCIASTNGVDTILEYTTDYEASISEDGVGGSVTLVSASSVGTGTLTVYRETTNLQESDYNDYNQFPAETLEEDLDQRTLVSQENSESLNRTVKMPITSALTGSSLDLPTPAAGFLIGWNDTADGFANTVNPSILSATSPLSLNTAGVLSLSYIDPITTSSGSLFIKYINPIALSSGNLSLNVSGAIAVSSSNLTVKVVSPIATSEGNLVLNMVQPINTSEGSLKLSHNATNLKITSNELNTIQNIHSTAAVTFGSLTVLTSATIPIATIPALTSGTAIIGSLSVSTAATIAIATITTGTITNLTAGTITVTTANITNSTLGTSTITTADITNLTAGTSTIGSLSVSTNATIPIVAITTGTITNLTAGTATITTLSAGTTNISALTAGSITLTGDIYNTAWTDYGATSTIVGWTSFTYKIIEYKVIGKLVFVSFRIYGVSNSTISTITLPYPTASNYVVPFVLGITLDNGTSAATPGRGILNATGSTITFYKDTATTLWTDSGNKLVSGQFFYEATI